MKTTKVKKDKKMVYSEDETDISEDLDSKKENIRKKPTRMKKNLKKGIELKGVKRKVLQNESKNEDSTSNSEIEMTDLREDDDTELDDVGNRCIICDDYGRDNELWCRCVLCGRWAHSECSGRDSAKDYKCDLCFH
ncbi:unnamed protein product [Parnassius mnemosyne]|uniref:Zinc finger PHD-type domain-containing protein n=1 Tax=Parnassius mnemosyne TaxID=213953 RepID=A0AAV1KMN6_9NEOP